MSDKKFYQEVCKTMEYKEKIKQLKKENQKLQQRIEKAIEYIENDKYEYTPMGITNKPINKELLEILKGSDK